MFGMVCFIYVICFELIRVGEEIDYDGVIGLGSYNFIGVNVVIFVVFDYGDDGGFFELMCVDEVCYLEIFDKVVFEFVE